MHSLLKKMHLEENINLLKARDYYFNKARTLNNRYRKLCLLVPVALTVAGMLFCFLVRAVFPDVPKLTVIAGFVENRLDIAVGIAALICFATDCILSVSVSRHLNISNTFRELYDCKIFDLPKNEFLSIAVFDNMKEHLKIADEVCDNGKYETWYRELFCADDFCNKICLILDNIIYTYLVYKANRNRILRKILIYAVILVAYTIWFVLASDSLPAMVHPMILLVAVFDDVKDLISSCRTAEELYQDNKAAKDYIVGHAEQIKNVPPQEQERFLRNLQDMVYFNRTKAMFIPKSIRNQFLDNKSIFYWELDEVKAIFMGPQVTKPECESDFEIPVPISHREGAQCFVSMQTVHAELRTMLEDVKRVWEQQVDFLLDGGTLIGCMRANGGRFLAWDDDVDISIRAEDVPRAKALIREKLGDKYVIQDYDNEPYYSPRLSTFRIRQKNGSSYIEEKDSPLYELYQQRGLFLDVYAYCPVLRSKKCDYIYRNLFIHPLHKHIKASELRWKATAPAHRAAQLRRFERLKKKYMRRATWYKAHAKCTDYYAYEPHYLENINTPGPYIPKEDLYAPGGRQMLFEGKQYGVPTGAENVLRAFYGWNWETSPLIPVDVLKQKSASPYHPILICRPVDFAYKLFFVLPSVAKRDRVITLQRERNEYAKYTKEIAALSHQIKANDRWYDTHAHNRKIYALRPESVRANTVNLYYDAKMLVSTDTAEDAGFDIHMYSRSTFEASVYKHVKSVWLK